MIANQNPALTLPFAVPSSSLFPKVSTREVKILPFSHLRTLFTLLPFKISPNPFRISGLRTLCKTTEGCPAKSQGFRRPALQLAKLKASQHLCFQGSEQVFVTK